MEELLATSLEKACAAVKAASQSIAVNDLNESVFRFLFASALSGADPTCSIVFECEKVDLAIRRGDQTAYIEMKYYVHSSVIDLETLVPRRTHKSFPSLGNYRNFQKSVAELRLKSASAAVQKYVVLFYADRDKSTRKTYASFYEDADLDSRLRLRRLRSIAPFHCIKTYARSTAHLFGVQA